MLPRKQKWPVYFVVVLAIVVLAGALLRLLLSGDEQERQQSLDERLRSVCERDPAPAEVRALVGDVVGRYQDDRGCIWRHEHPPRGTSRVDVAGPVDPLAGMHRLDHPQP